MLHNLGFALEYSLGHTTHAQNLKGTLTADETVLPFYVDLPFHDTPGWWSRLPGIRSNWSARASLGAYYSLRRQAGTLDAVLFHTQVTSLFAAGLMRRLPSVISLDATPLQYDALGAAYGHAPSSSAHLEQLKMRLNVRAFHRAKKLVTWSQWAKDSLVADYGVPADKIDVIPPGIDLSRWDFPERAASPSGPVRLLFVGGDFVRKGGDTLLEAFQQLPPGLAHLDIVTQAERIENSFNGADITVHRGLGPNSEALLRLYASADLFVFPTRADCLPLAVMEALASGLPVITTSVAALPEAVTHGETGWIVPPNDPLALAEAIRALASDPALRLRLSRQSRQSALERFDAAANYRRLVETVKAVAR